MRPINEIIVHCAATPEGKNFTVADIDRWHKQRGWSGIGYHAVVYLDGSVHAGRPETKIGAHVAGHNSGTLGICYIGGVDANDTKKARDTRTAKQKQGLEEQIVKWLEKYPSINRITGHNQYAAKACPCFDAEAEYAHLLEGRESPAPQPGLVRAGMKGWRVKALQERLNALGYPVNVDSHFGQKTKHALLAFQSDNEITVDGIAGSETWAALETAVSVDRGTRGVETAKDLKERSRTVRKSNAIQNLTAWGGGATAVAAGAEESGVLEQGEQVLETGQRAWSLWEGVKDLLQPLADHWYIALGLLIVFVIWQAGGIKKARVEDHQSGKTV